MENKNISSLLKEIKLTDNKKMDSLSKDISEESRKDAVELVKILHSGKEEEAQKAIEMFNGKEFESRPLTVNEARPREEGNRSRGGFNRSNRGFGGQRNSW